MRVRRRKVSKRENEDAGARREKMVVLSETNERRATGGR